MTRRNWITLFTSATLSVAATVAARAQEKKKTKTTRETRWDGRVRMFKKDESTIVLRVSNAERQVVYGPNTQFTVRNKNGSLADVKEGGRVICLGALDEKGRLIATRVDVRLN